MHCAITTINIQELITRYKIEAPAFFFNLLTRGPLDLEEQCKARQSTALAWLSFAMYIPEQC